MSAIESTSSSAAAVAPIRSPGDLLWAVTLAGVWFWTFRVLALWWQLSPVYEYGFVVPWIALFLAWQKVRRNPDCMAVLPARGGLGWGLLALSGVAWGAMALAELLRRIDPVWRPVSLLMLFGATLLTVVWASLRGGKPLLKELAFPIGFMWTAAPWPGFLDDPFTMNLRAAVTVATAKALGLFGIHAVRNVNVLELAQGPVGVEDACSGIVSLHSSLMVSLFLGEFLRLPAARRVVLVIGACGVAVGSNLLRTFTLCALVTREGIGAVNAYHDRLGLASTVLIFGGIVALGWMLTWRAARGPQKMAAASVGLQLFTRGGSRVAGAGGAMAAFFAVPLLASGWFTVRPGGGEKNQESPLWSLHPERAPVFWQGKTMEIPSFQQSTLGFNEGESALIQSETTGGLQIFHFFWRNERSGIPYGHTPDICMGYAGWKQKGSAKNCTLHIGDNGYPAKAFRFEQDGHEVLALHTFWRGGEPGLTGNDLLDNRKLARLPLLLSGPRLFGMEELLVFVSAPGDDGARIGVAEEILSRVLIPSAGPVAEAGPAGPSREDSSPK